ncbi:HlyD family secretion protein [Scleromatobacter humisilvae]|uniref:HlyD family secretion protein n=1 Tax=Scleromatobacter humisilvae TaxID=2897159 RepID=A0A9X2C0T6_9BURK|nr:HlyD family secretion protein [Scleromatobacter humisilvae]MCK9684245.1 HlyD family secretion protein [Scleromatobacter humisilvae]
MSEMLPEDNEEGARQSAFRAGYRTGFGDGFEAADKVHEATRKDDKDGDRKQDGDDKKDARPDDKDKDGGRKDDKDKKDDGKPPLWKRPLFVLIAIVVVIALIIVGTIALIDSRHHETTDDAFIDGNASQIAAQAAGRVSHLYVDDNQLVHRGDPLVDIDTADINAKVDQAKAGVLTAQSQAQQALAQVEGQKANAAQAAANARQAEAESVNAQQDLARFKGVDPDAVSRQQYDQAVAQARAARAKLDAARATEGTAQAQVKAAQANVGAAQSQVATAQADLETANIQLGYAHVVAPIDGRVTKRAVDVGNVISIGQPILAIVSDNLWVTANYKETQLKKMRVNQAVTIKIDAVPDVKFAAHVQSFQRAAGSYFSALPAENATGNYVKVTQRVPVKIVFDHPEELQKYNVGPGMSVKPSVSVE